MASRSMKTVVVTLSLLAALSGVFAAVHNVGGGFDWMVPNGKINYTEWANNVTVRVGDSLYFKYNPNAHNVLKVNSTVYAACDNKNYLQIWDTGDTTVMIQEPGMHYFICGAPKHCQMFQAFFVLALPDTDDAPSNTTSPGGLEGSPSPSGSGIHFPSLMATVALSVAVRVVSSL